MGDCLLVRRYLLVFGLILSLFPPGLMAQSGTSPPSAISFELALQALQRSDIPEAQIQIEKAISQDPTNLDYKYVLGGIYIRLQRFPEAEAIFLELVKSDEKRFQTAYFALASIYAQQVKEEKVLEVLQKARSVDAGQADFETGLAYMRLNKPAQALEFFKRAALTKPELAGEATLQQGIAHLQLKKFKEAKRLFAEALKMKLPPERAVEARRLIEDNERAIFANKPWHISLSTAFQYNDNLFSTPLAIVDIPDQAGVTGQADFINFTSLAGRYDLFQQDAWKAGLGYGQFFATYVSHSEQNLIGTRPSVYLQWEQSPYLVYLEYAYNQFVVNNEADTQAHSIWPRFSMMHGKNFRSEVFAGVDWRISKQGSLENTHSFMSFYETYLMLEGRANVRAGYSVHSDDFVTQPDAWSHEIMLGTQWPIYQDKWFLDVIGLYTWRNFDFDPVFLNERRDDEQNVIVRVFGQLTPLLQLSLGYQHTWNDSNVINEQSFDPFNYTRAVYTCMLTFNY